MEAETTEVQLKVLVKYIALHPVFFCPLSPISVSAASAWLRTGTLSPGLLATPWGQGQW